MTSVTADLLGMKKSSGGVNSIGVQVARSSNQSLPHASTDKIEWNVEDKNDDGMFDSGTSNTDINILEDGWYSMWMYCYVGDSATNGRNSYVYLNGVITSQNTEIINTGTGRSEEHTSELQSLMHISYAVFCLTQQITSQHHYIYTTNSN